MAHPNHTVRVGGMWLAAASFLMIVVLAFHGPISPDLNDQMAKIAENSLRWAVIHGIAAASLSLFAMTGVFMLTSRSRLNDDFWITTAWAVMAVGALWTVTTAVAEMTVVANAAATGNTETFLSWWAFAEGNGNGIAFLALAVAVIARHEAQATEGVTPAWAAWIAAAAGVASFAGWIVGMWFEIALGNLLWVVASLVMSAWTLWFGVVLTRSAVPAREDQRAFLERAQVSIPS